MTRFVSAIVLAVSLCGCLNIATRMPGTDLRIEKVYQSTRGAAVLSYVIAFPQIVDFGGEHETFVPENIFTIPIGMLGLVDTACEAVIDTVCFPADFALSKHRFCIQQA